MSLVQTWVYLDLLMIATNLTALITSIRVHRRIYRQRSNPGRQRLIPIVIAVLLAWNIGYFFTMPANHVTMLSLVTTCAQIVAFGAIVYANLYALRRAAADSRKES